MIITHERPGDAGAIETLLDTAFGPGRTAKTVYRLRAGIDPLPDLSYVAIDDVGVLVGTLRYWPVSIGGKTPTLMLGPIAVCAHLRGQGVGAEMIRLSLEHAAALGHQSVLLVGDAPYYQRFGFSRSLTLGLTLPGPVDLDRFLGLELVPGALTGIEGPVQQAMPAQLVASAVQQDVPALPVLPDLSPAALQWAI